MDYDMEGAGNNQKPQQIFVRYVSFDAVENIFREIYKKENVENLFYRIFEQSKNQKFFICLPYLL
jgi:hypothetical protein